MGYIPHFGLYSSFWVIFHFSGLWVIFSLGCIPFGLYTLYSENSGLKFPENRRSEICEPWKITVALIFNVADYQNAREPGNYYY